MRCSLLLMISTASGLLPAAELHAVVTDAAHRPVADAVVYATPVNPPSAGEHRAVIDQVHRQFVPAVSVVQVGTAISFPNSDNIRHSVYSFSKPHTFTLKLYAGTPSSPVLFDQPGVVVLGCNIHDTMVGWILVVNTPYLAHSAADGSATLTGIPAGDYVLRAWNNSMGEEQAGEALRVGGEALGVQQLRVDAQPLGGDP